MKWEDSGGEAERVFGLLAHRDFSVVCLWRFGIIMDASFSMSPECASAHGTKQLGPWFSVLAPVLLLWDPGGEAERVLGLLAHRDFSLECLWRLKISMDA